MKTCPHCKKTIVPGKQGRPTLLTPEIQDQIFEMHKNGDTYHAIKSKTGFSVGSIANAVKRATEKCKLCGVRFQWNTCRGCNEDLCMDCYSNHECY